jgi:hypothetical protein
MNKKTDTYIKFVSFFAGIAMVAYAIEGGSKIISTIVAMINPVAAKNLYMGLDMSAIYAESKLWFLMSMSIMIAIPLLKMGVWWAAIWMLKKLDIDNPFKQDMTKGFNRVIQLLNAIVILSVIGNFWIKWLIKKVGAFEAPRFNMEEYIFMTLLIFIFSLVFRKGHELKQETDLTI